MMPHPSRRLVGILAAVALLFSSFAIAAASPSYVMDITVDPVAGTFSGELAVEIPNPAGRELEQLFFRLLPNATTIYGEAELSIDEIRVDEIPVDGQTYVDHTVLLVPLEVPLAPEASVSVSFAFQGKVDRWNGTPTPGAYGLLTRSEHALTLTAFYPILALYTDEGWSLDPVQAFGDALMSEAAAYDVRLTVPADYTPVASGITIEQAPSEGGAVTYRFAIDGARDFSAVLVQGREAKEMVVGDIVLRAWFRPEHAAAAHRTLELASDALTLYQDRIGMLAYREVEFAEVPMQWAAGVELSGLVLVSSLYAARPDDLFYDVIVAHEMAHQWFYAAVGNDIIEHPWLDESFATYLSYVFLDVYGGPGDAAANLAQWRQSYERAQAQRPGETIASPVYAFASSSTYSGFIYSGGALFLHEVRRTIGDDAFFGAVSTYYREHQGAIAEPADLITALEDACGCPLTDLLLAYGVVR